MLTVLLISMLTLAFGIQPVKATETNYNTAFENTFPVDALLTVDKIIGTTHVKYWQHVINNSIYVKNDFILMHIDVESGEIVRSQKKWREIQLNVNYKLFQPRKEYFWKKLVVFPDRDEYDFFYTFYDPREYPLVCWEVRHTDGTTVIYNLDGNEIGYGVPAPSEGFSLSGYHNATLPDPWVEYRGNADDWFSRWCVSTVSLSLPTPGIISSYVSDPDIHFFYELAHGGSYRFQADSEGSYYYSSTVTADMSEKPPMKFAFIGSCEGMTATGPGTFSHEFRKGQIVNTVTIGYTRMASAPGWPEALNWQNYMFQRMNEGYTIKASFDLACTEYPIIAPNVVFVGDENLCARTIIVPDDYPTIQQAADAADSGDTVYVRAGTYYEAVSVDKSLSLVGEDRETTVIDGGPSGRVMTVSAYDVDHFSVTGFTIRSRVDYMFIGIGLSGQNCSVSGNNVENCYWGIYLTSYSEYSVIGNNVRNCNFGMYLGGSSGNNVEGNNVTANNDYGILLYDSSNNNISGNNVTNNEHGIGLYYYSYNNNISGNNVTNNYGGILLADSSNNNNISGNNVTANNWYGIALSYSSDNSVGGNNVTANNYGGIHLTYSSDNNISGNNIANNEYGILLADSSNNTIYHNNFVDNGEQVDNEGSTNVWDDGYRSGGNYWSDYTGVDGDGDGIGDTAHVIDANNQDNYPLMSPWTALAGDIDGDGDVDRYDFGTFAGAYGTTLGQPNYHARADLNSDGDVDRYDFGTFAGNYGKTTA
jgi:nitrous oxidase accessory protein